MKILELNAGALTNFEVLDFLRAKGASKDRTRVIANVAQSEYKVYDYLVSTAACGQTRESINDFLKSIKKHELSKAEVLNIINIRPTDLVEVYPIIEYCVDRFPDEELAEIAEKVNKTLPLPPVKIKPAETNGTEETTTLNTEETTTLNHEKGNGNSQGQNEGEEVMDTS